MLAIGMMFVIGSPRLVAQFGTWELPSDRVTGLSVIQDKWVAGTIRGLYVGAPGKSWKQVSNRAVRQVLSQGREAWVMYGDGSVDKLDVEHDRLYYDVFNESVKRPWASSMTQAGSVIYFGGSGGWFVRDEKKPVREIYPSELGTRGVTFAYPHATVTIVGTQDGLYEVSGKRTKRFGFGQGLADTWMTSIASIDGKVMVGTYTGGLYQLSGSTIKPIPSPSKKIVHLAVWNHRLVIGALDGSWVQKGTNWEPLTTGETTFLKPSGHELFVGTAKSVSEFE